MTPRELEDRYHLETYTKYPFALVRGEGPYVWDDSGRRYLDLYGGHAVCVLGHGHPRWREAIARQAAELAFYSNVAYHPLRAEAARLLVEKSYPSMHAVFFANSGAEANEAALKIARKATGRDGVIAMEGGFHGRTLGALAVTASPKLRAACPGGLADLTRFVPFGDLDAVRAVDASEIAAVILEPVQSMAGVRLAGEAYYRGLRDYTREKGIALIFDEVQTGNGRTGRWFAGGHFGVEPDLVTTAKGLGGGFPVSAVIANGALAGTVKPGDQGSTFGGGPLAAAAVAATYRILEEEGHVERTARLAPRVMERLRGYGDRGVRAVRGLGYLIGVECAFEARRLQRALLDEGVLAGSSNDPHTMRLLPPLVLEEAHWEEFFAALDRALGRIQ